MKDKQTYDAAQALITRLAILEREWKESGMKAGIGFEIDDDNGAAKIWVQPSGMPKLRLSVQSDVYRVLVGDNGEEGDE